MTNSTQLKENELKEINGGVDDQITTIHKGDYFISKDESLYLIARVGNENATTLIAIDFDMYACSDNGYMGKWNGSPLEMSTFFVKVPDKCDPNYMPHD